MSERVTLLTTPDALDAVIAGSFARPALIFKHSVSCGTSAYAHEELDAMMEGARPDADIYVVHVQTGRAVSNAIAERFALRHESPQALLVKDGILVWHASHYGITHAKMADAIARHRQG